MPLRTGIVGAGRAGTLRARQLEAYPDVRITGVADPNRPARDAFVTAFGVPLAVSDHRRLVADEEVDIVFVTAPPATHSVVILDTLQAGKHVICEQPMAISLDQAKAVIDKAENSTGRLFVALPQRYDRVNQEVFKMIEDDRIGYPYLLVGFYLKDEFDRLNDWHDWKGTWDVAGGGILMEHGCEIIDLLHYLIGDIGAVSTVCTRFGIDPLHKAEDSCLLGIEFIDDISADLSFTGAAKFSAWPDEYPGTAMRLEVYGLAGSIRIMSTEPRLTTVIKGAKRREIHESEIETSLPTDMIRDFLDCILEDKDPLVNAKNAFSALRVVLAAYKSSQMKRRVEMLEEV